MGFLRRTLIGLTIAALGLVAAGGTVLYLTYEKHDEEITFADDLTFAKIGEDIIGGALDYTGDPESPAYSKINFALTETVLQKFCYILGNTIKQKLGDKGSILKCMSVDVEGNKYIFYVDASYADLATRFKLEMELTTTADDFYFKLDKIAFGKLQLQTIAKSLVGNFLKEEDLQKVIDESGFHMEVDMENWSLKYKKVDMINDMKKQMNFDSSKDSDSLIGTVISYLLDTESHESLVDLSVANETISLDAKLEPLHTNTQYVTSESYNANSAGLNVNTIRTELEQDTTITDFTKTGLTDLWNEKFNAIKPAPVSNDQLTEMMLGRLNKDDLANKKLGYIDEREINSFIQGLGFLGYTTLFPRVDSEGVRHLNYICLDDVYVDIMEENVNFIIGLNVSGYETQIIMNTEIKETNEKSKVAFEVEKMYFGRLESDELKVTFCDLMQSFMNDSSGMVSFNEGNIIFSFESFVSGAQSWIDSQPWSALAPIDLSSSNIVITPYGEEINSVGKLEVSIGD